MRLLYVQKPRSPQEAIDFFISEASKVEGCDYGDCMREWNRELLYLRDRLHEYSDQGIAKISPWAFQKLDQMQMYIQFTPNWDVESTHDRILRDANELREHLVLSEQSGRAA